MMSLSPVVALGEQAIGVFNFFQQRELFSSQPIESFSREILSIP